MNEDDDNNQIQYDESSSKKDNIKGILFLVWFLISIVALLVVGDSNGYIALMIFGQLFFGFGLVAIFSAGSGRWMGIPFVLIGAGLVAIPYFMMKPQMIPILGVGLFIIVGLVMIIVSIVKFSKLKKACTVLEPATVITKDYMSNDGKQLACPVYGFEFNNKEYQISNNHYSNVGVDPVGTELEIKINPNNQEQFLENMKKELFFTIIMGVFFILFTLPAFIFLLVE